MIECRGSDFKKVGCVIGFELAGMRNRHPYGLSQSFHAVNKIHALIVHQEANGGTMLTTSKAVVELFVLTDCKGGGVFCMKRAEGLVIFSGFFKLNS